MYLEHLRRQDQALPVIESPDAVTSIKVWMCKYRTLAPIGDCTNLRNLVINTPLDSDLRWTARLTRLEYLWIQNPAKIGSLEFLSALENLVSLSLSTPPSWDSAKKTLVLEGFSSIKTLKNLRHIELFGVCSPDKSLAAVKECRSLISARFNGYPAKTVEDFYAETGATNQFAPEPVLD